MKKSLLIGLLFCAAQSYAQNYYHIQKTGSESWYSSTTTGSVVIPQGSDDIMSAAQSLPFTWSFFGNTVTQYKVSDNGYITFDAAETVSDPTPEALPSTTAPKNAIFGYWTDLELKTFSTYKTEVRMYTSGTAPNRRHVIQWFTASKKGVAASTSNYMYFAIRLYEAGGFDVAYNDAQGVFAGAVGVNNSDGTVGYMASASASVDFPNKLGGQSSATDKIYQFVYGVQPSFDVQAFKLNLQKYAAKNTNTALTGTLINYGKTALTSFDLNYSVNGGAAVKQSVSGQNITGNGAGSYSFNHSTPLNISTPGTYTIKVWADNLNGNADENNSNDTLTAVIIILDKVVPKKLLHEVFTSSTCPPCTPGNINLHNILDAKDTSKYTVIKYQQDFPGNGDPYCTSETINRRSYYAINSIPRMELDGGWDGNANIYTTNLFDEYQAKPAIMEIHAYHTINFKTVSVDVTINPLTSISNSTRVHVVVLEKLTFKNVATNGETEFLNVAKKMLPNNNGTTVTSWTANTSQNFKLSWTVPGPYRLPVNGLSANRINLATENTVEELKDLTVVVFVQDAVTKEVYQSVWSNGTILSTEDMDKTETAVTIYPTPANELTTVAFNNNTRSEVSLAILNATGQKVMDINKGMMDAGEQEISFDASSLAAGVYMLQMNTASGTVTKKFVVAR